MKITNNILAFLTIFFILISLVSFYHITIKLNHVTGQASQDAAISFEISQAAATTGAPVGPNTAGVQGGGRTSDGERGFLQGYTVDPTSFSITTIPRKQEHRQFTITNNDPLTLHATLATNLDFITVSPESLSIAPGQKQIVDVFVTATTLGLQTGKIHISSDIGDLDLPIVIRVNSPDSYFNVRLDIPDQFLRILPGEPLLISVILSNLEGGFVDIDYVVKDSANKELLRVTEITPVKQIMQFDKTLQLPQNMPLGSYVVGVEAHYQGKLNVDSKIFRVVRTQSIRTEQPLQLVDYSFLIFIIILLLLAYMHRQHKKQKSNL